MSQASDWVTASDEQEAKELAVQVNNMGLHKPEDNPPQEENDLEAPLSAAEMSLLSKAARDRLYDSTKEVEVLRKDPNSPLYSVKSFQELHLRPELLLRLAELNFMRPSKIQETTLPSLLACPPINLIAQSQSGTGKTAAFCLGMLSRVDTSLDCVQAICLSPTFELANQTTSFIKNLGRLCTDIRIRSAVKGDFMPRGSKVTEHIIIGTPGKMVDWATKSKVLDLSHCKVFALDEADVMISQQGHQDQSVRIHRLLPPDCQMMLFSATYDDNVLMFAEAIIRNPVVLRLRKEEETLKNIKQVNVICHTPDEKFEMINLISSLPNGKLMFFCKTKATALWLSERLTEVGHNVAFLSGDLTSQERVDVLKGYRACRQRALVCTNVVSRGIDIQGVTLVVNFDLPDTQEGDADCETYLHRIGRTGRFGKIGVAVNIIDGPRSRRLMDQIESHFKIKIPSLTDPAEILEECKRFKD